MKTKTTEQTIKDIKKIKCIKLDDKLPKGWNYLTSWDCEYLLRNNFKMFKDLEFSFNAGYYRLNNGKNNAAWLWLLRLGNSSYIDGDNWDLNYYNRVRGVLIWR